MAKVYRESRIVDVQHTHWEEDKLVVDSIDRHMVTLEVDVDGLFDRLARKAVRSKGGRAVEASGLVTMRRRK